MKKVSTKSRKRRLRRAVQAQMQAVVSPPSVKQIDRLEKKLDKLEITKLERVPRPVSNFQVSNPYVPQDPVCMMLVKPSEFMCRWPSMECVKKALVRSVRHVEIFANFTGSSPDDGRWAFYVQPKIGAPGNPINVQVGLLDVSGGWPAVVDITTLTQSSNSGQLFTDLFFDQLTQPSLNQLWFLASNGAPTWFPSSQLSPAYSGVADFQWQAALPFTDRYFFPPGLYNVDIAIIYPTGAPVANLYTVTLGNVSGNSNLVTIQQAGYVAGGVIYAEHTSYRLLIASRTDYIDIINITLNPTAGVGFMVVNPTMDSLSPIWADSGDVDKLRPVGMSVLYQNSAPQMIDGGDVAIAYLPGDSLQKSVLGEITPSSLVNFEKLAETRDRYKGPQRNGAYAWYSPANVRDLEMRTPNEANAYLYPFIMVAGQATVGVQGTIGYYKIGTVEIVHIFEFETNSQLYEVSCEQVPTSQLDTELACLHGIEHCSENPAHLAMVKTVMARVKNALGKAYSFYLNNKSWINPALRAVLTAL